MKRTGITLILTCFYISVFGQINIREIATKQEAKKPLIYDSSDYFPDNQNIETLKQYIGEKIYILPISKYDTVKEYNCFYRRPEFGNGKFYPFQPPYDSLASHTLTILDADQTKQDHTYSDYYWYFKLLYHNSDTIYLTSDDIYKAGDNVEVLPFMLNGYYEKSKHKYKNQFFIQKENISAPDINTGLEISSPKGTKWKCVDISLVDLYNEGYHNNKYYFPVLIFKSDLGYEISVSYVNKEGSFIDNFYTMEEYKYFILNNAEKEKLHLNKQREIETKKQAIKIKYGDFWGQKIIDNVVGVGMTSQMCKASWGTPSFITHESEFEVWQYNYKTFLYFKDSKLKTIKQ